MKSCPKCSFSYNDDTLEFCLEDGTRLISAENFDSEIPTITISDNQKRQAAKTNSLPFLPPSPETSGLPANRSNKTVPQSILLKEKAIEKTNKVLEIAPFIIALAHNWWQWVYLSGQSYASFTTYLASANFLVWLVLLGAGTTLGLLSLKRVGNRNFAIAGLVIIAINLLLFLVPKR